MRPVHYHARMNWQDLLDRKIQDFIIAHEKDDVKALALKKPPQGDWPYPLILDQIKARQKAQKKMPRWLEQAGIVLPPADLVEQASSDACARYKATITSGESFIDLTGGSGMDSFALLNNFQRGITIERHAHAAGLIAHNAGIFGLSARLCVHHGTAESFLETAEKVDLVYLDPQRRDEGRKGKFDLASCEPDIFALLPLLQQKTRQVLLKTSPVLDIHKTLLDLEYVRAVHIVQYQGDCKELLFLLDFAVKTAPDQAIITALSIGDDGQPLQSLSFTLAEEQSAHAPYAAPQAYLYEPGPAFQKAQAHAVMAKRYGVNKLHPHTHLYTSAAPCPDFPGRHFKIEALCAVDKKELKAILPDMKANLGVRNFPATPEDLRKKLGLKDGGDVYLFAGTLADGSRALIKCIKSTGY